MPISLCQSRFTFIFYFFYIQHIQGLLTSYIISDIHDNPVTIDWTYHNTHIKTFVGILLEVPRRSFYLRNWHDLNVHILEINYVFSVNLHSPLKLRCLDVDTLVCTLYLQCTMHEKGPICTYIDKIGNFLQMVPLPYPILLLYTAALIRNHFQ